MVEVVRAVPEDWERVRWIRLAALTDAPDAFGATLAAAQAHPEAEWRRRLAGPHPTYLAVDGEAPVAMGGGFELPDPAAAMVWGMWTAPSHRGRGLGRRVLDATVRWARAAGRTPYLHVTEGNGAARALYVSYGFEPTGEWEPLREGSDLRIEEMVLRRG